MSERDDAARSLRERYGGEVELAGEGGAGEKYRILAELTLHNRSYAIMQSDRMRREGEIEVFRVLWAPDGACQLETVEDDEEWENVAEWYDDLQFGSDDRP